MAIRQWGDLVLAQQDEARFPMVPTLVATLGGKGHRPAAGTRDGKDRLYVFAAVNPATAAVHRNTLESPKGATKRTGLSKTRRMPAAIAADLRHVSRVYPAASTTSRHRRYGSASGGTSTSAWST